MESWAFLGGLEGHWWWNEPEERPILWIQHFLQLSNVLMLQDNACCVRVGGEHPCSVVLN